MVTGASSGVGRATTLELARRGFHVVAAGRSEPRTKAVVDTVISSGGSAEPLLFDLASFDSVRRAASDLERSERALDVLVNNAGVGARRGLTSDGFELAFGTNHLGHFLLWWLLRPSLAPAARIVQVSSEMHRRVDGIDFDRLRRRSSSFFGLDDYAVSKLANILFAAEMARRHPALRSYAVHPGFVDTGIIPSYVKPFVRGSLISPDEGARTVVWCAANPEAGDESGQYYLNMRRAEPSPVAGDTALAEELWARSESWCGVSSRS